MARCTITWKLVGILGHWWRVLNKKADFYPCLQSLWYQTRSRAGHLAVAYGWRGHPSPCGSTQRSWRRTSGPSTQCTTSWCALPGLSCTFYSHVWWAGGAFGTTSAPESHMANPGSTTPLLPPLSLCATFLYTWNLCNVWGLAKYYFTGMTSWWCRCAESRGVRYACASLSWSMFAWIFGQNPKDLHSFLRRTSLSVHYEVYWRIAKLSNCILIPKHT